MLLKDLINQGISIISSLYPEREAREMVFAFMQSYAGTRRYTHILNPDYVVESRKAAGALEAFRRMATGEPLQYIIGKAYFYGREFDVNPDVLIPRPETEILCRESVDFLGRCGRPFSGLRVLDLCTGSGCIAWTIALECPGVEVIAADLSDGALKTASSQNFSEEMEAVGAVKPRFMKADVLAGPLDGLGVFDLIVSNPPYVMESEKALMRTNVLDHEPAVALFVSDEEPLVFYRAIARWAAALLDEQGLGIVEINEALAPATASVLAEPALAAPHSPTTFPRIIRDLNDRDRFILFRKPSLSM